MAKWWAPSWPGLSPADVLDRLLAAVWSGELLVDRDLDQLVVAAARVKDHPGFAFTPSMPDELQRVTELPDGSILVDLGNYIVWSEHEPIKTAQIANACEVLAGLSFNDFSPLMLPVLYGLKVRQADFIKFCNRRGYKVPDPGFWPKFSKRQSRLADSMKLRQWLKDQASDSLPARGDLLERAKEGTGIHTLTLNMLRQVEAELGIKRSRGAPIRRQPSKR